MKFTKLEKITAALRAADMRFMVCNGNHVLFGPTLKSYIYIRSKDFTCMHAERSDRVLTFKSVEALLDYIKD